MPGGRAAALALAGVALAAAWYILFVLFDYDNAWIHPEAVKNEAFAYGNGAAPRVADFARGLDYTVLELGEPRISRPLSGILFVFDSKIRLWLWRFIPPHPVLGLRVVLCLLLTPPLLYAFFRNLSFGRDLALVAALVYACSPGFLSPLVLNFHAGKSILNLVAVFLLWVISRDHRRLRTGGGRWEGAPPTLKYLALVAFLFVNLLWDETALFLYLLLPALFPGLWRAFGRRFLVRVLPAYLLIPPLYYLLVRHLLALLAVHLGYPPPNLLAYDSMPSPRALLLTDPGNLLKNGLLLFGDHLHLQVPGSLGYGGWGSTGLALLYQALLLALILLPLRRRLRARRESPASQEAGEPAAVDPRRESALLAATAFGLMLAYVWFHTFQLSNNWLVWGAYWYGAPFSLLFAIFLAALLRNRLAGTPPRAAAAILLVAAAVLTAGELVYFTARNAAFKELAIFRRTPPNELFEGKANVYRNYDCARSRRRSRENRAFTRALWERRAQVRGQAIPYAEVMDFAFARPDPGFENLRGLRRHDPLPEPYDNTSAYLDVELPLVK